LIDGGLFTRDFLVEGIKAAAAWQALDDHAVESFRASARSLLDGLAARRNPNEAQTEDDLVYPLLEAVGWHHRDVQPNASVKARHDVPDALLFADAAAKTAAGAVDPWRRFAHGLCVVEAKRWGRALDREERGRKGEEGTPSSQMLRYLRRVDDITDGALRWGILTNGRVWRLYFQGALSVAEDFFEIDLGKVLETHGCDLDLQDRRPDVFIDDRHWRDHVLRLFVVVFGRDSFLPDEQGETFQQLALREGRRWEVRVARSLSDTVLDNVFPALAEGLAAADPARPAAPDTAYLAELRESALILLYRMLFVLYAEDRNLLPDENGPYAPYCLTRIRQEVAAHAGQSYPKGVVTLWPRLTTIFRAISEGNDDLGIPAYNGGLFDPAAAPILNRVQLPDAVLARVIFGLSHQPDPGDGRGPKYINYRDLSVQQLGSVYEGILEFGLRIAGDGRVEPDADDEARHRSGSYYTPDELVALIIERAVGPLVDERIEAFRAEALALASDQRPAAARLEQLAALDPAAAILSLKIIDPAMGSGHFLVSLVDWLSESVLDAIEDAKASVTWGDYASPLAARIAGLRARILQEAKARRWAYRRSPARRPPRRAAHGAEARRLRRRQEPDGGRTRQGGALAAFLHRRRAAVLPRSSPARRRQRRRRLGRPDRRRAARAGCAVQPRPDRPCRAGIRPEGRDRGNDRQRHRRGRLVEGEVQDGRGSHRAGRRPVLTHYGRIHDGCLRRRPEDRSGPAQARGQAGEAAGKGAA
jgi:hypothetical protein